MKKIISLVLVTILTLSAVLLTGCGAINDSEVSILWAGEAKATNPNSLINSMDRAMYIESVSYVNYGANGNADEQLEQAKAAVDNGCDALVVELVSPVYASQIVDYAKAKSIPVVFVNCLVDESVVASYDKCAVVNADITTVADVQGEMIADYVKANFAKLDKNEDGKISYFAYDLGVISVPSLVKANKLLATADYVVKTVDKKEINTSIELADVSITDLLKVDPTKYELVITADDLTAFEVLKKLQEKDYNTDKLTTHFVPVITVGDSVDYKAYVVKQGKDNYEANKYLVNLTTVKEDELEEMIYTTRNVVGTGRLAGTVVADGDAISGAVAQIIRNLIKEADMMDGVASQVNDGEVASVLVNGKSVKVRYISLTE